MSLTALRTFAIAAERAGRSPSAVSTRNLEGCVCVGFQENFGECILPSILGRFALSHPKVHIEGCITRNKKLREKVANGQLDLALTWRDSSTFTQSEKLADIPLCWLASRNGVQLLEQNPDASVPLIALEAPCLLWSIACDSLDRRGMAWIIAFESPTLSGLWPATDAGLGIVLRARFGKPENVQPLAPEEYGRPRLPSLGLVLASSKAISSSKSAQNGHCAGLNNCPEGPPSSSSRVVLHFQRPDDRRAD